MERFLTINSFAKINAVSRSTVYRENKQGRLPFVKIGRSTRIAESAAKAWREALETSGRT